MRKPQILSLAALALACSVVGRLNGMNKSELKKLLELPVEERISSRSARWRSM